MTIYEVQYKNTSAQRVWITYGEWADEKKAEQMKLVQEHIGRIARIVKKEW